MSGTTLCPHCNTRFKIAAEQLEAHQGMVRCGNCLQAFDARPGFIPAQPNPQLELPMLNEPAEPELPAAEALPSADIAAAIEEAAPAADTVLIDAISSTEEEAAPAEALEIPQSELLDFHQPVVEAEAEASPVTEEAAAPTLAEQVAIVQDEVEEEKPAPAAYRRWPWAVAASLLSLVLFAQAAYFYRVELAARLPGLKPALIGYCRLLGCSVPLPQNTDLMSIESSDLEADPEHVNQITLNALLRNRASYAQAYPNLELTLNDTQDKPLARRIFKPRDYLPPQENEQTGLLPNREVSVKLYLYTADLRPTGYRLVLHYPQQ
ncbi:zinc-ribbon and DUF3426 domain-containing protein [Candidatus Ferrigenium straubiae]|jgi:predicted Zn finger-like uncharacterized protein|uniref:zinc-ribbon and DUF3426 domain-containing protein n=1 Tax=Candidatus Ferrigenium straubiae TaxID=2919506 RepID=UPI003F4ADE2C